MILPSDYTYMYLSTEFPGKNYRTRAKFDCC